MKIPANNLVALRPLESQLPDRLYPATNDNAPEQRKCRDCGCDDWHACIDENGNACYWVTPTLCSACVAPEIVCLSTETIVENEPAPPSAWVLPVFAHQPTGFWSDFPAALAFYALMCVLGIIFFGLL